MKKQIVLTMVLVFTGLGLLIAQESTEKQAEMNVLVMDMENNSLEGEQIIFVGKTSGKQFRGVSDAVGKFTVKIDAGDTYEIQIKSIGEAQVYNTIIIPSIGPDEFFPPSQLTIKIKPATVFTLNNVYFDVGKSALTKSSVKELNELYAFLKYKKQVKIEIGGHTDNVGSSEDNKVLSQARANSVKNYLVKRGIDPLRIKAVGYGEDQPVDTNSTPEGKQKNRRTEVKVLE